jgi:hypothetical protein
MLVVMERPPRASDRLGHHTGKTENVRLKRIVGIAFVSVRLDSVIIGVAPNAGLVTDNEPYSRTLKLRFFVVILLTLIAR